MATEKKIVIKYDDGEGVKEYTLMFNKWTVRKMQEEGFDISQADTKPNVVIPDLFAGAFRAKQPFVEPSTVQAIYDNCPNKGDLVKALIEMYSEPIKGLMEEPDDSSKNVEWTIG